MTDSKPNTGLKLTFLPCSVPVIRTPQSNGGVVQSKQFPTHFLLHSTVTVLIITGK